MTEPNSADRLTNQPNGTAQAQDELTDALELDLYGDDDEFDPLEIDYNDIDQEEMDDDNPYDTIDYPTIRNMPEESRHHDPVYSPATQGSAQAAVQLMLKRNPARRPVLLSIMGLCEEGCASSVVTERVTEWQKDNLSVYSPMTLCRMLERAGALELEMPEVSEEHEVVDDGVVYLEITDSVDPVWRTTEAGREVYEQCTQGAEFREMVLVRDARYLEVYQAVMERIADEPRTKQDIEDFVATFPICQKPLRFGNHFLDILEATDAIIWSDHAWRITDLGRTLLEEVRATAKDAPADPSASVPSPSAPSPAKEA